jgi:DNA replication protein DnaC
MRSSKVSGRTISTDPRGFGRCYDRLLRTKMDSALNTPFSDWGNILFNTTIATAIADRLVENSEIFMFGGDSLRKPKNPNPPAE